MMILTIPIHKRIIYNIIHNIYIYIYNDKTNNDYIYIYIYIL